MRGEIRAGYRLLRRKLYRQLFARKGPRGRGPGARTVRRFLPLAGLLASATMVVGLTTNLLSMRNGLCGFGLLQPWMGDLCAAAGVDGFPTAEERQAWEALPPGDCDALRRFADLFPKGAKHEDAIDRLRSAIAQRSGAYTPAVRVAAGTVGESQAPFPTRAAAELNARARARRDAAALLCIAEPGNERFAGSEIREIGLDCRVHPWGGHVCALDYQALCRIEERRLTVRCG